MHKFVIFPYPWNYCAWDEKYKWDSIMRKMLYGAAEFCLLSASSKLPFISDWGTGRWELWLSEYLLPRKYIKIWSLSIHRIVDSHFTLSGVLFPEKMYKMYPRIANAQLWGPIMHYCFSLLLCFKSDHIKEKKLTLLFLKLDFSSWSDEISTAVVVGRMPYVNHDAFSKNIQVGCCAFWL